jgi:hypothetical protein
MVKKPMVYYTDETPVVNKRLVAGYYLFLCLLGFTLLLGPTGSGIPVTLISDRVRDAHELATPDQGSGCYCHTDELNYWNMTVHSGNQDYYNDTSGMVTINGHAPTPYATFNATCARCHAINWDNSSYPDTHEGFGTNCYTCHSNSSPYYSVDGEVCGTCHSISVAPHYFTDDWSNSAHANSLTDLRTSSHASSSCMHCMSGDGFLSYNEFFGTNEDLDPQGDYNSITCPACHSVHSPEVVNPAQIWAVNSTALCGLCHSGTRYPMYDLFTSGPHGLTGILECTTCHGYQEGAHGATTNHTFYIVNATATCGQSTDCHQGQEAWAISQLEEIQSSYDALVTDIDAEATAFEAVVTAYNATAGANYTLTNYVQGVIDDAMSTVSYYNGDRSFGFHNPTQTFADLNSAYRDILDAKAYYYANLPAPAGGIGADTLIIVAGAAGGIVVGLLLGVLVGRRR